MNRRFPKRPGPSSNGRLPIVPSPPSQGMLSQSSPQVELLTEQVPDNGDGQTTVEGPNAVDQLRQSIAKLFQPAQLCKEHLAEIAKHPTLSTSLPDRPPSYSSRSRVFAIICRGFRSHSRRCARFRTISVYLLIRSSRAKRCTSRSSSLATQSEPVLRKWRSHWNQSMPCGRGPRNSRRFWRSVRSLQAQFYGLAKAIGAAVQSER
jgi:hypothetical protein